jgi:rhodopsin domain-containing protein
LFIKASILKYYLRFPSDLAFRIVTYFTMFVAIGYSIPQAFVWSYICKPMARYWDFAVEGQCINVDGAWVSSAALNMATDIIILLLPIWLLWPLRLPTLQKVALTLTLMAGGFVCAVSIVRLQAITSGLYDPDVTNHYVINLIWW